MKLAVILSILSAALPLLIGPLTYGVGRWLLNVRTWIDDLPPIAKQTIIAAIAIALPVLFHAMGIPLPGECAAAVDDACFESLSTPVVLQGVIGFVLATTMHALKKSPPNDRR